MGHVFDVGTITAALAEAAVDPSRWKAALQTVEACTNSCGALFLPVAGNVPFIACTRSMEESFDVYVRGGWHERDERYRGGSTLINRGVMTDDDCMAADRRKNSAFYQDFLAAQKLTDFAGVRVGRYGTIWNLSLQRSVKEGAYTHQELSCLADLAARLDVISQVNVMLALAQGQAALDAFQFSRRAAFLLNRAGEVTRFNEAAQQMLGDDLQIIHQRLSASDRSGTQAIELALRRLLWTQDVSLVPPVVLRKRAGGRFIVYAMSLSRQTASPFSAWHAVLIVTDTDAKVSWITDTLCKAFDLSPAEARLAAAIGSGEDLGTYAARNGLSKETVRNQLKAIFSKTGTHRQAELVVQLTRLMDHR